MTSDTVAPCEAYLDISDLWKSFGEFIALRDIALKVARGEFICFLGPSGCGKTTLLRAIAGLDPQSRGTIRQGGRDVSRLPPSQRDFGIVFQSYALFPNLTIRRNIAFGLENAGRSKQEISARVSELLELVGLTSQAEKYPAQLSGGQQQRIALARAIAVGPGLLLLDEPLSALDAKVRVHLRGEIKALQRKLGVTTIMVTHDQEEALAMADRIVVMNNGVIEQIGTPTEIYRTPASLFVAEFIGETNRMAGVYNDGRVTVGPVTLITGPRGFHRDSRVQVAIRPEDVVLRAPGESGDNLLSVRVAAMEFLGTWWRCLLAPTDRIGPELVANVSVGAARRAGIAPGKALQVEIPPDRVLIFPKGGADA
ncbi:putative 2-aminoethylphosphonate ABC transporter ATP-binding protein [Paenirhodobacter sp.]|uniref:putative 2-aminoethylphosphonate ABC transporter ATP-binding protein n=1 Tax=Paenirhodobacter sp. TaxID=1965326 RepID=UPI003B41E432